MSRRIAIMCLMTMVGVAASSPTILATPAPGAISLPAIPHPESCTGEPRAVEALTQPIATPQAATPPALPPLASESADPAVVSAVTETLFDLFACFNAGEPLRAYALYSDGYLRRILASETPESLTLLATPYPLNADEWTSIIDIREIRLLDDDRVYATVVLDPGLIPVVKIFGFYLIEIDGRWLVDDVLDELEFSLP